jgi:hypothetical protein
MNFLETVPFAIYPCWRAVAGGSKKHGGTVFGTLFLPSLGVFRAFLELETGRFYFRSRKRPEVFGDDSS